jgi:hypothetical protein
VAMTLMSKLCRLTRRYEFLGPDLCCYERDRRRGERQSERVRKGSGGGTGGRRIFRNLVLIIYTIDKPQNLITWLAMLDGSDPKNKKNLKF